MFAVVGVLLERLIPHGMTKRGRDRGSWETPPEMVDQAWTDL
jgi:tRNA-splicing ligase RtcB